MITVVFAKRQEEETGTRWQSGGRGKRKKKRQDHRRSNEVEDKIA